MQLTKMRFRVSTRNCGAMTMTMVNKRMIRAMTALNQDRINSTDQDATLKVDCKKLLRQFNQMAQDSKTIRMHVQIQHNATKRKRGAKLPAPEPKRRAPFNPPRNNPFLCKLLSNVILKAKNPIWKKEVLTENMQMMMIQFSRCLPQTRCLSQRNRARNCNRTGGFFGVKHKSECSPGEIETWLAETAAVEMAKADPIEEIPSGKKELGDFRRAHARFIYIFHVSHISPLTRF
jgi:hypothetical protein